MSDYWFFMSYARTDDDPYLRLFYRDLGNEIRMVTGLPSDASVKDIGFFDQGSVEVGDTWDTELADALQNSRVMVCMNSRGYFNSEWGGIEFQVFRSRVEEYIKDSPGEIGPPPLIIPVLWRPPRLLSGSMPKPLADPN